MNANTNIIYERKAEQIIKHIRKGKSKGKNLTQIASEIPSELSYQKAGIKDYAIKKINSLTYKNKRLKMGGFFALIIGAMYEIAGIEFYKSGDLTTSSAYQTIGMPFFLGTIGCAIKIKYNKSEIEDLEKVLDVMPFLR